jgi:predicted RNA methylase
MTNLSQQLEDKKKGCRKLLITGTGTGKLSCGDYTDNNKNFYCDKCQEIIAILEQAIAEMQKQRQEIFTILNKLEKKYSEIMTYVGEQPEWMKENKIRRDLLLEIKDKLNQPKTEETKHL